MPKALLVFYLNAGTYVFWHLGRGKFSEYVVLKNIGSLFLWLPFEAWVTWVLCSFPKDDGPTARDLMMRYATNKKTTKRKKKLEKAMKVLKVSRGMSDFPSSWLCPSSTEVPLLPSLLATGGT